jgi:hypothetical protein
VYEIACVEDRKRRDAPEIAAEVKESIFELKCAVIRAAAQCRCESAACS